MLAKSHRTDRFVQPKRTDCGRPQGARVRRHAYAAARGLFAAPSSRGGVVPKAPIATDPRALRAVCLSTRPL